MTWPILLNCLLIVMARITDVSLGTLRTVNVINGRGRVAWALGFCEVLIWIMVVSKVVQSLSNPAYALAYAFGFATGNYLGIAIEKRIAYGEQVLRIFTRQGGALADSLRSQGFGVTEFEGRGREGPVYLLFLHIQRRQAEQAAACARGFDPDCYVVIDDIKHSLPSLRRV